MIGVEDSLARAADMMRESTFQSIPILLNGTLQGVVTENSLLSALFEIGDPHESVMEAASQDYVAVHPTSTSADVARKLAELGRAEALVVSTDGRFFGIISASDFYPKAPEIVNPGLVGGMATPFGVYLTNGAIRAGATDLALVTTGMMLFTLFFGATIASEWVYEWAGGAKMDPLIGSSILNILPLALFLLGLRTLPLAGIHGAEHKVVHAIERGEPLVLSVVRRMPRVHPRCGTNLAAGATLFLGISSAEWIPGAELRLLVAIIVTLSFWRPLGNMMQYWVTTRNPSDKQLEMGIRSGKELLQKFAEQHRVPYRPLERIWASGMLHVIFGSMVCAAILKLVAMIFNIPIAI